MPAHTRFTSQRLDAPLAMPYVFRDCDCRTACGRAPCACRAPCRTRGGAAQDDGRDIVHGGECLTASLVGAHEAVCASVTDHHDGVYSVAPSPRADQELFGFSDNALGGSAASAGGVLGTAHGRVRAQRDVRRRARRGLAVPTVRATARCNAAQPVATQCDAPQHSVPRRKHVDGLATPALRRSAHCGGTTEP